MTLFGAILKQRWGGGQGFTQPPFWATDRLWHATSGNTREETIDSSYEAYASKGVKGNSVVYSLFQSIILPFSEALFIYQNMDNGLPGALDDNGGVGLELLREPWPNGTTGDLLAQMEMDRGIAGNSYWTPIGRNRQNQPTRLRNMRPDWVTIVSGVRGDPEASAVDLNADVLAYIYHPQPPQGARRPDPVMLTPSQVAHYRPVPDPTAQWRGMAWMTPTVDEIAGDTAATTHKLKFFENGATGGVYVTYDPSITPELFQASVKKFEEEHAGVGKAYKTFHVGGGADVKMATQTLQQLDFKVTQGAGETRMAAASGVGAVMAQLSEGLQGSSLNAGNFKVAKERSADMVFRPLWRNACASLEKFTQPRDDQRLWYASEHISLLQDDENDRAQTWQTATAALRQLTDAGWDGRSARDATAAYNIELLDPTTFTPSVQVQEGTPTDE